MSIGSFPEVLRQTILARIILVGRLGVRGAFCHALTCCCRVRAQAASTGQRVGAQRARGYSVPLRTASDDPPPWRVSAHPVSNFQTRVRICTHTFIRVTPLCTRFSCRCCLVHYYISPTCKNWWNSLDYLGGHIYKQINPPT